MTMIDLGIYGAKRQTWRKANPRYVLLCLIKKYPKDSPSTLCRRFFNEVASDPGQLDAIIEYWFAGNYPRVVKTMQEDSMPPKDLQRIAAAKKSKLEEIKAEMKMQAARITLLDLPMPNGKQLRDCTGKDCAKAGGWLTKIAAAIKPTDVVGAVLSETQVRKMWGAS